MLEGVAQSKAKHEDPGPTTIFTNMKKNCLQEENGSPSRFNLPKQQWLKMVYYGKPRAHLMHLRHLDKDNTEAPLPIKNEATKVLNRGRKKCLQEKKIRATNFEVNLPKQQWLEMVYYGKLRQLLNCILCKNFLCTLKTQLWISK